MPARIAGFLLLLCLCAAPIWATTPAATEASAPASELPSPEQLIERVRGNQRQLEAMLRNYIYRKTVIDYELGKDGERKEEERREYECRFVGAREVERLVAVNGKPLSEKETRKAEQKAEKEARKAQHEAEKRAARAGRSLTDRERRKQEEARLKISEVLRATSFHNGRWETLDGHRLVAYDFEPRSNFKPRNREQQLAHKLAGTIWVDADAGQVVLLRARFTDDFKVGAGILGSVRKGSLFTAQQQRVNEEIWLPSRIDLDLNFRILIKSGSVRHSTLYSDYLKFRVDHAITVVDEQEESPTTN